MLLPVGTRVRTIGALKDYLKALEANWTKEDQMYLGAFDDQTLHVLTHEGVDRMYLQYHGEFGLIAFPVGDEPEY